MENSNCYIYLLGTKWYMLGTAAISEKLHKQKYSLITKIVIILEGSIRLRRANMKSNI